METSALRHFAGIAFVGAMVAFNWSRGSSTVDFVLTWLGVSILVVGPIWMLGLLAYAAVTDKEWRRNPISHRDPPMRVTPAPATGARTTLNEATTRDGSTTSKATQPFIFHGWDGSRVRVNTASGALVGQWQPSDLGVSYARLDFATPVELCHCCGEELLASGSRWSVWFCGECAALVKALNERAGACVIPIGRHSLMNGASLTGGASEVQIDDFVVQVRGMSEAIDRLLRWANEIVRRNCAAASLDGTPDVPLSEYLVAVRRLGFHREARYDAMLKSWADADSTRTSD